ncbi:MAG: discoidin domain-containing protein [Planctomycetes bacterium]|nr:discoidin domain-containing protein [Planctomycetota bacterium]
MFDRKLLRKIIVVLLLAAAAIVFSSCKKDTPDDNEKKDDPSPTVLPEPIEDGTPPEDNDKKEEVGIKTDAAAGMIPLPVVLPEPIEVGTPIPIPKGENMEEDTGDDRPTFYVPKGTTNVALKKTVTCPDEDITPEELERIVDGDMSGTDGTWVELGLYEQQITIDLGAPHEISAILLWHYFKETRVYYDVVVQTADDADFITNAKTHFNNDFDDTHGIGAGKDKNYVEKPKGKLINAKGIKGRYVRLYSAENSVNQLNHYVEVAVFGKRVE